MVQGNTKFTVFRKADEHTKINTITGRVFYSKIQFGRLLWLVHDLTRPETVKVEQAEIELTKKTEKIEEAIEYFYEDEGD